MSHLHKGAFFFLLQSEQGDLYKVTIEHREDEVKALKIKYFDTVPVATSLCILKSGFLFVASEFGDQLSDILIWMLFWLANLDIIQPFLSISETWR